MATYKVDVKDLPVEINGVDQGGNTWPKPRAFDNKGYMDVNDDEQDVIAALESAVAAGVVTKVKRKE